jgi:hypothetical protein
MTNEYAAALAKEAECAFRATQQVVDRYNAIHAHALGGVLGAIRQPDPLSAVLHGHGIRSDAARRDR